MPTKKPMRLNLRVSRREKACWSGAAKRAKADDLSSWIRHTLNVAAVPPPPSVPPAVSGDQVELPLEAPRRRTS